MMNKCKSCESSATCTKLQNAKRFKRFCVIFNKNAIHCYYRISNWVLHTLPNLVPLMRPFV